MKAVIPARGSELDFYRLLKHNPKKCYLSSTKPTIQYVVEEAVASGIDDILIVTGKGKKSIEDHFDKSFELEYFLSHCGKIDNLHEIEAISEMADIYYVRQKDRMVWGTQYSALRNMWMEMHLQCF